MRSTVRLMMVASGVLALAAGVTAFQGPGNGQRGAADDPIRQLVERLDLGQYKANIKGLTDFGDRRQGTKRNRDAVDWIEAQLKSYGCTNTERITYQVRDTAAKRRRRACGRGRRGRGGCRWNRRCDGRPPGTRRSRRGRRGCGWRSGRWRGRCG